MYYLNFVAVAADNDDKQLLLFCWETEQTTQIEQIHHKSFNSISQIQIVKEHNQFLSEDKN